MNHHSNGIDIQKRFFLVEISVDGKIIDSVLACAYTQDNAIIHVAIEAILIRFGLAVEHATKEDINGQE